MKKSEPYEYNIHPMNEFVFNIENVKFTQILETINEPNSTPLKSVSTVMHYHHYYEVFYVFTDDVELVIEFENEAKTLKRGDMICISPLVHHLLASKKNAKHKISVLNFMFEKNSLRTDNDLFQKISMQFSEPYLFLSGCNNLYPLFLDLTLRSAADIANDVLYQSSVFFNLLMKIFSATDAIDKSIFTPKTPAVLDSNSRRLFTIDNIINTYYNSNISLQEIANMLHLSTKQISRIILKEYGCTFYRLLIQVRMRKAATLLRTTDLSVIEISQQVGYGSTSNFYNIFKKTYGVMPLEYRKANGDKPHRP